MFGDKGLAAAALTALAVLASSSDESIGVHVHGFTRKLGNAMVGNGAMCGLTYPADSYDGQQQTGAQRTACAAECDSAHAHGCHTSQSCYQCRYKLSTKATPADQNCGCDHEDNYSSDNNQNGGCDALKGLCCNSCTCSQQPGDVCCARCVLQDALGAKPGFQMNKWKVASGKCVDRGGGVKLPWDAAAFVRVPGHPCDISSALTCQELASKAGYKCASFRGSGDGPQECYGADACDSDSCSTFYESFEYPAGDLVQPVSGSVLNNPVCDPTTNTYGGNNNNGDNNGDNNQQQCDTGCTDSTVCDCIACAGCPQDGSVQCHAGCCGTGCNSGRRKLRALKKGPVRDEARAARLAKAVDESMLAQARRLAQLEYHRQKALKQQRRRLQNNYDNPELKFSAYPGPTPCPKDDETNRENVIDEQKSGCLGSVGDIKYEGDEDKAEEYVGATFYQDDPTCGADGNHTAAVQWAKWADGKCARSQNHVTRHGAAFFFKCEIDGSKIIARYRERRSGSGWACVDCSCMKEYDEYGYFWITFGWSPYPFFRLRGWLLECVLFYYPQYAARVFFRWLPLTSWIVPEEPLEVEQELSTSACYKDYTDGNEVYVKFTCTGKSMDKTCADSSATANAGGRRLGFVADINADGEVEHVDEAKQLNDERMDNKRYTPLSPGINPTSLELVPRRKLQDTCSGGHSDSNREDIAMKTASACGGFEWFCLGFGLPCLYLTLMCCCCCCLPAGCVAGCILIKKKKKSAGALETKDTAAAEALAATPVVPQES